MSYFLRIIPNKPEEIALLEIESVLGPISTDLDQNLNNMGFEKKNPNLCTLTCAYADQYHWAEKLTPLLEASGITLTKKIWIEKLGGWFDF